MDPGITEIAAQLADRIPTGADSPEQAVQDWRDTLYNAKQTACMGPLAELIKRSAPDDDPIPHELADQLTRRR